MYVSVFKMGTCSYSHKTNSTPDINKDLIDLELSYNDFLDIKLLTTNMTESEVIYHIRALKNRNVFITNRNIHLFPVYVSMNKPYMQPIIIHTLIQNQ